MSPLFFLKARHFPRSSQSVRGESLVFVDTDGQSAIADYIQLQIKPTHTALTTFTTPQTLNFEFRRLSPSSRHSQGNLSASTRLCVTCIISWVDLFVNNILLF